MNSNNAKIKEIEKNIKKKEARLERLGKKRDSARTYETKKAAKQQEIRQRKDIANKKEEISNLKKENNSLKKEINRQNQILHPEKKGELPCFSSDTLVWTVEGTKRIDQLQNGESILAYDFERDNVVIRKINRVLKNKTRHFYKIVAGNSAIYSTGSHPFWIESQSKWIEARELKKDMRIKLINGNSISIDSITLQENFDTSSYNLSVYKTHNYFVGIGVLVHNKLIIDYNSPSLKGGFGNLDIYECVNPDYPGKVYIGQTDDIPRRQGEHRDKARKMLTDPSKLTKKDLEFYRFMEKAKLQPRVKNLNQYQANYLEQKNLDIEREIRGRDNVMNRKEVVKKGNMEALAKKIANDPKVQEAGYCPK